MWQKPLLLGDKNRNICRLSKTGERDVCISVVIRRITEYHSDIKISPFIYLFLHLSSRRSNSSNDRNYQRDFT